MSPVRGHLRRRIYDDADARDQSVLTAALLSTFTDENPLDRNQMRA